MLGHLDRGTKTWWRSFGERSSVCKERISKMSPFVQKPDGGATAKEAASLLEERISKMSPFIWGRRWVPGSAHSAWYRHTRGQLPSQAARIALGCELETGLGGQQSSPFEQDRVRYTCVAKRYQLSDWRGQSWFRSPPLVISNPAGNPCFNPRHPLSLPFGKNNYIQLREPHSSWKNGTRETLIKS